MGGPGRTGRSFADPETQAAWRLRIQALDWLLLPGVSVPSSHTTFHEHTPSTPLRALRPFAAMSSRKRKADPLDESSSESGPCSFLEKFGESWLRTPDCLSAHRQETLARLCCACRRGIPTVPVNKNPQKNTGVQRLIPMVFIQSDPGNTASKT